MDICSRAMKFTEDVAKTIIAQLNDLLPGMKCPLCHTDDWIVVTGYLFLPVYLQSFALARSVSNAGELPCVAITCKFCGNTHLLNLVQLGLDDLLKD